MALRTDNLPQGYKVVAELVNLGFEKPEKLFIVTSMDELVLVKKSPPLLPEWEDEPGFTVYQTEFPRSAARWIVDSIENKLWRSASEGGLPSGTYHIKEMVDGELLKIRRVMNVGAQGQKGFALLNLSRHSLHFQWEEFQEIQVTDMLLREGRLLDALKSIEA